MTLRFGLFNVANDALRVKHSEITGPNGVTFVACTQTMDIRNIGVENACSSGQSKMPEYPWGPQTKKGVTMTPIMLAVKFGLPQPGLFKTFDEVVEDVTKRLDNQVLRELLQEWVTTRRDTIGSLSSHYPIDDTLHGFPTEPDVAWGCNRCGEGWPCLTMRTERVLNG